MIEGSLALIGKKNGKKDRFAILFSYIIQAIKDYFNSISGIDIITEEGKYRL